MPRYLRQVTAYRKPVIPIMNTGNEIVGLHGTVDLFAGGEATGKVSLIQIDPVSKLSWKGSDTRWSTANPVWRAISL